MSIGGISSSNLRSFDELTRAKIKTGKQQYLIAQIVKYKYILGHFYKKYFVKLT